MKKQSLTVIILTKNEEVHIARAINSIISIASDIFVIDSYSSDSTVKISKKLGAKVYCHKFINQAKQMQWVLDNIKIKTDWVMRLDADEVISPKLAQEISSKLPSTSHDTYGIILKRKHVFMNKTICFGGRGSLKILRIWRNGFGCVEQKLMDEHIFIKRGTYAMYKNSFLDWNLKDLSFFIDKHNEYATREAVEQIILKRNKKLNSKINKNIPYFLLVKRLLKAYLYDKCPYQISSFLYFIWRYLFLLGFLDGINGFNYHFLQAFWYRFLVGLKTQEIESLIKGISDNKKLRRLIFTCYKIDINNFNTNSSNA
jgi:glycosyltransferase involved in cell wall biosynthesis